METNSKNKSIGSGSFFDLAALLSSGKKTDHPGFSTIGSWDDLFELAEEHRVIPLLHKAVSGNPGITAPRDISERLNERYRENSKLNFARSTQLLKLVNSVKSRGLSIAAYKGPALAERFYKELNLRQFTDLDVIVKKEEFEEVDRALRGAGCTKALELTAKQEAATLRHSYDLPYFFGETNTLIEVHWQFIEKFFAFDFHQSGIWDRVKQIRLLGKEIPTLADEDALIVACVHGSKHFWKRLSWICDVDRIVAMDEIDWSLVESLARESGSLRMVKLGLWLADELLGTTVSDKTFEAPDAQTIEIGRMMIKRLAGGIGEPENWKEMAAVHVRMKDNFPDQFRYCGRLFATKLRDKLFMPMGHPT